MAEKTGYEVAVEQAWAAWRVACDAIGADFAKRRNALLAEQQRALEKARIAREVETDAALAAAWLADGGGATYGYDDYWNY